jgi:hypothetical protein
MGNFVFQIGGKLIVKIKLYSVNMDMVVENKTTFRGSFSRHILWDKPTKPQRGMTLILPSESNDNESSNSECFRFYITDIIIDFRNDPFHDTILVDKRLFSGYKHESKAEILSMKLKLRSQGWKEVEEGEPFEKSVYV